MIPGVAGYFDAGASATGGPGADPGVTVTLEIVSDPIAGAAYTLSTSNPYDLGVVGTLISDGGLLGGGVVNTFYYYLDSLTPIVILVMQGGHVGNPGRGLTVVSGGVTYTGTISGYDDTSAPPLVYYGFTLNAAPEDPTFSFELTAL